MVLRHQAGRAHGVEDAVPVGDGARHEDVDVTTREIVGVFVVAAEHDLPWVRRDERVQRLEASRRGALSDQDLHAEGQLLGGLVEGGRLVVGRDPGLGVGPRGGAAQSGRVAVDRQAARHCRGELGHDARVLREDAGEIHDLREEAHPRLREQRSDLLWAEGSARGFEPCRGDAAGRTEREHERRRARVLEHLLDPRRPEHVGDLVGVCDARDGAVPDGQAAELTRGQQRALDVEVRVDEAGHHGRQTGALTAELGHAGDDPSLPGHPAPEDPSAVDVHDVRRVLVHLGRSSHEPRAAEEPRKIVRARGAGAASCGGWGSPPPEPPGSGGVVVQSDVRCPLNLTGCLIASPRP
jgi:hypothetical protein